MSFNPARRIARRQRQQSSKENRRRYLRQTTPDDRAVHNAARRLYSERLHEARQNGERPDLDELWASCEEDADDLASVPGETVAEREERLAAQAENAAA